MKRMALGISICCAVLGSAVILLSGMKHGDTAEEWKPLNARLESTSKVDMQQTPVTHTEQTAASGGNAAGGNGKGAALEPAKMEQTAQPEQTTQSAQPLPPSQVGGNLAPVEMQTPVPGSTGSSANPALDQRGENPMNTGTSSGQMININTAQAAELTNIPGIGAKKAQAIIEYRNQHGPFKKVTDLEKVKGIGAKMLEKMKPHIEL